MILSCNNQLNGIVKITTPDINLGEPINLLDVPVDATVSQICQPPVAENQSSFTITGTLEVKPLAVMLYS